MTNMNIEELHDYRETIENMNKLHQTEILKILLNYDDVTLSENSNGTFLNMSSLNDSCLNDIKNYILYYKKQTVQLNILEDKKEKLQNDFFNDN